MSMDIVDRIPPAGTFVAVLHGGPAVCDDGDPTEPCSLCTRIRRKKTGDPTATAGPHHGIHTGVRLLSYDRGARVIEVEGWDGEHITYEDVHRVRFDPQPCVGLRDGGAP